MTQYDFILKFDDIEHSLTAHNGLSVAQVGEILINLSTAISKSLVLSDVLGNCYALEITTSVATDYEALKVVHRKLSIGDYEGLTTAQKDYAQKLRTVMGRKLTLSAYTKDKAYLVKFEPIEVQKLPEYYYETSTVYGVVTAIGSKSLEDRVSIRINEESYPIYINQVQEKQLIQHYKRNSLGFTIKQKVSFSKDTIVSAELLDVEIMNGDDFITAVEAARLKYPDGLLQEIND